MAQMPLTAALAGIPGGLQKQGVWSGRRPLFIRFGGEAETATMYTADALAGELKRATTRSSFHSIAISGRDPLGNVDYLRAALDKADAGLPVMLDCDGQRPDEIAPLRDFVAMVQVTLEGPGAEANAERAFESIKAAAKAGMQHAMVLCVDDRTTDAHVLRFVERAHATSSAAMVVVHPAPGVPVDRDRRWTTLFERASALHGDVRLILRLPPPTGMR
jgi:pyruvate-formate lyase-activating enzyme